MPRPTLLPTPASSTDLAGKDGQPLSSHELSFALPPPAITSKRKANTLDEAAKPAATVPSYRPNTPISPSLDNRKLGPGKRRASASRAAVVREEFTLPPPPTRSRKIIQMKPQLQDASAADHGAAANKTAAKGNVGGRKKKPSATSAAGRKIARKTAHSLIERRRRSKMNEEFGVLKQMIPACRDQEMHKLAILQASIEYLRYLEQCIVDLEANSRGPTSVLPAPAVDRSAEPTEMGSPSKSSAGFIHAPSSRSLESQMCRSASVPSSPASPAFGAQASLAHTPFPSTSPAMPPQGTSRDIDHEATEALLLLNTDRRGSRGRGMSVKDLLTS